MSIEPPAVVNAELNDTGLQSPFKPGSKVYRYTLLDCIGIGGMGWVFRAFDESLENHIIALKIFYPHLVRTLSSHQFEAEALTARRLTHPHVVQVYNYHRVSADLAVMSMELVEGSTLTHHIVGNPGLSVEARILLIAQIASALAFAHRSGVLHRDIKPDNILVDESGEPKVADFGIAQLLSEQQQHISQRLVGTPTYMAPEQFSGEILRASTDVYSFGILTFFILFGRPPFEAKTLFELANLHNTAPMPLETNTLAEYPDWLKGILLSCTAKRPQDRPASMETVFEEVAKETGMTYLQEEKASGQDFSQEAIRAQRLAVVEDSAKPVMKTIVATHAVMLVGSILGTVFTNEIGYRIASCVVLFNLAGLFCRKSIRWTTSTLSLCIVLGALAYLNPWTNAQALAVVFKFETLTGHDPTWLKYKLRAPFTVYDPESFSEMELEDRHLRAILRSGVDLTLRGLHGETLLHRISSYTSRTAVERLVTRTNLLNATDIHGDTPLHYATRKNQFGAVDHLLTFGANPNAKNLEGVSPLYIPFFTSDIATVGRLLCSGADPNQVVSKKDPNNLIYYSIYSQNIDLVLCLISAGATLHTPMPNGLTPLEYAQSLNPAARNYDKIVYVLKEAAELDPSKESFRAQLAKKFEIPRACYCEGPVAP